LKLIIYIYDFNLDDEDFCRVCLQKETNDQSDYINASIIRCIPPVWNPINKIYFKIFIYYRIKYLHHQLQEYFMLLKVKENEKILIKKIEISFSGPTEQTLDDFIRMIIEQQITVIVMLSFPYDPITCTYAVSY